MKTPVALVTGVSSGIGQALARALAGRGHDLVVVARREDALRALADELPVQVEVLAADLATAGGLALVEDRLVNGGDRPVTVLVNNAGVATAGPFVDVAVEDDLAVIDLNVIVPVRLIHAALPGMRERRSGSIVNLASVGAFSPSPRFATYAASKAFVLSLTEALHEELRGTGVRVMALCPGFTRTEFQQRAGMESGTLPDAAWMTADAVAEAGLDALASGRVVCVPGIQNRAMVATTRLLPRVATRRVAGWIGARG